MGQQSGIAWWVHFWATNLHSLAVSCHLESCHGLFVRIDLGFWNGDTLEGVALLKVHDFQRSWSLRQRNDWLGTGQSQKNSNHQAGKNTDLQFSSWNMLKHVEQKCHFVLRLSKKRGNPLSRSPSEIPVGSSKGGKPGADMTWEVSYLNAEFMSVSAGWKLASGAFS